MRCDVCWMYIGCLKCYFWKTSFKCSSCIHLFHSWTKTATTTQSCSKSHLDWWHDWSAHKQAIRGGDDGVWRPRHFHCGFTLWIVKSPVRCLVCPSLSYRVQQWTLQPLEATAGTLLYDAPRANVTLNPECKHNTLRHRAGHMTAFLCCCYS